MQAPAFTARRRVRFLHFLAQSGNVRRACEDVGVSPQSVYVHKRRDAAFARGWDAALLLARDAAEEVLAERALHGVREMIFYRGEAVGSRMRFDGRLLLAHLARLDRHHEREEAPHAIAARFDDYLDELIAGAPGFLSPDDDLDGPPQWRPRHPTREEALFAAREGVLYSFPRDLAKLPPEQLAGLDPETLADPDLWSRLFTRTEQAAETEAAAAWDHAAEARLARLDTLFTDDADLDEPEDPPLQEEGDHPQSAGEAKDPPLKGEGDHPKGGGGVAPQPPLANADHPPQPAKKPAEPPYETKAAKSALNRVNRVNRRGGRRRSQRMKSAAVGMPSGEYTRKLTVVPTMSTVSETR